MCRPYGKFSHVTHIIPTTCPRILSYYKWGKWGPVGLNNLAKVTRQGRGRETITLRGNQTLATQMHMRLFGFKSPLGLNLGSWALSPTLFCSPLAKGHCGPRSQGGRLWWWLLLGKPTQDMMWGLWTWCVRARSYHRVMLPRLHCANQPAGELMKTQMAGPHTKGFWAKGAGVVPENLHF